MSQPQFTPAYVQWDALWAASFKDVPLEDFNDVKRIKAFIQKLAELMNQMTDSEIALALMVMARPFLARLRVDAFAFREMTGGGDPDTTPFAEFL